MKNLTAKAIAAVFLISMIQATPASIALTDSHGHKHTSHGHSKPATGEKAHHGGNMDIKGLVPGTTLYLPVFNEGAQFSAGDGHDAQGDGEVCVTAIETCLSATFELHIRKDMSLNSPRAETPSHYITMAFDPILDEAAKQALRDMLVLIQEKTNLSKEDAYALCSIAGDLHVSQIVNQHKGVHMMLAKSALHG